MKKIYINNTMTPIEYKLKKERKQREKSARRKKK